MVPVLRIGGLPRRVTLATLMRRPTGGFGGRPSRAELIIWSMRGTEDSGSVKRNTSPEEVSGGSEGGSDMVVGRCGILAGWQDKRRSMVGGEDKLDGWRERRS